MSNFIYDDLPVPNGKSDASVIALPSNQKVVASEWNEVMQYLLDIQSWARGANWSGLTPQGSDPAPSGVTHYLWLNTSGQLMITVPAGTFILPMISTAGYSWAGATLAIGEALTVTEAWSPSGLVTGASVVHASYSGGLPAGVILVASAVTANEVQATFLNLSGASQTLASGTLRFIVQ